MQALVEEFLRGMPPTIACTMNLGRYDFYPAACGKGNAVRYIQVRPLLCVRSTGPRHHQ